MTGTDPFDALRADTSPIDPAPSFATDLRGRLTTALDQVPASADVAAAPAPITRTPVDRDVQHTVTPYLTVRGAAAAIDFYVAAFGAVEHHRLVGDDGRIGHAEILIGDSRLSLADEYPEYDVLGPQTLGGATTAFTIDVDDADAAMARAVAAGATVVREVADQFHGHRTGAVRDPFGHRWNLSAPLPAFDDARYARESAEIGFTHVAGPPPANDARRHADPQWKRYGPGDLYYFTLPTRDVARAQRFYAAVLGWRFDDPDNGHVANIAAPPGGVNAGDDRGARLWFVVDDIHAAVDRVRAAGGTAQTPIEYPSGWAADCVDDQGTEFSLSVPSPEYGALDA